MTDHTHTSFTPGCFRCELNKDEMAAPIPTDDDPFMSTAKAAKLFDVRPATVRNWIADGKIKAVKIDTDWRILTSEVHRFVNEMYGSSHAEN